MARINRRKKPFQGYRMVAVGRFGWATLRLFFHPDQHESRVIFFMSAKIGTAPERNLIKRRIRIAWRSQDEASRPSLSLLVIGHKHTPLVPYANILPALAQLLKTADSRISRHPAPDNAAPARAL